ncbi:MAG: glycosyltransferase [Pseudomonadota bacterium]|nr:glycosyltransferase [Pseudomonadota bacterium]
MANAFFGVSLVCLLLFLHPYLTYVVSLRALRTVPLSLGVASHEASAARSGAADATLAPVSATLVFAAYNEALALPHKIANLRAIQQAWPDIEMIAYSDGSSDQTVALLKQAGDVVRVIDSRERAGKASGMRHMVSEARGEIVIFTDANVILDPASIAPLLHLFSDPGVGGVAGSLRYINNDAGATARAGGFYWRLEETIKRQESRVGSIMGADGSIFAIRRALYPEVRADLLDDMTASLAVTFAGFRLIHSSQVVGYEKNATVASDEFRRKRRIACRAFNTHRVLWPRLSASYGALDIYKYVSHKLVRWLGLVPLALGVTLLAGALALGGHFLGLALLLGGLSLFAVAGSAGLPGFATGWQILMAITATFLGVTDAMRGRTMQVWTPAASRN